MLYRPWPAISPKTAWYKTAITKKDGFPIISLMENRPMSFLLIGNLSVRIIRKVRKMGIDPKMRYISLKDKLLLTNTGIA
jgi:hypothetical protein